MLVCACSFHSSVEVCRAHRLVSGGISPSQSRRKLRASEPGRSNGLRCGKICARLAKLSAPYHLARELSDLSPLSYRLHLNRKTCSFLVSTGKWATHRHTERPSRNTSSLNRATAVDQEATRHTPTSTQKRLADRHGSSLCLRARVPCVPGCLFLYGKA